MHCVAGDGVGILVGAVLARHSHLEGFAEIALEYVLVAAFAAGLALAAWIGTVHFGVSTRYITTKSSTSCGAPRVGCNQPGRRLRRLNTISASGIVVMIPIATRVQPTARR